jgi:hypothetical protein
VRDESPTMPLSILPGNLHSLRAPSWEQNHLY